LNILSRLDLEQVLSSIISKATILLECTHGQIYLFNKGGGKLEASVGIGGFHSLMGSSGEMESKFLEEVVNTGYPIVEMTPRNGQDPGTNLPEGVDCLMGVPLMSGNNVIGVICIAGEAGAGMVLKQLGTEILNYFSQLASIAVQNAQLFSEVEESRLRTEKQKKRMERELKIARTVQIALLPREFPTIKGWSFAARWKPANEVAGDYYDFILREDDCFDLIIADVTDKGVPAALFMAHSKALLHSSLETTESLIDGVSMVNQSMIRDNIGPFVTMFLSRIDPKTGEMNYINAGHESPLVYLSGSDETIELSSTGLPLGIDRDIGYQEQSVQMNLNDFIVLYTDGVTEAMDQAYNQFGKDALIKTVHRNRHETTDVIAERLLSEVERHIGPMLPSDDIAILVARRLPLT
jgi:serine phosphatase RsbU (regulator of sigma subunit)